MAKEEYISEAWESGSHEWQRLEIPDERLPINQEHILLRAQTKGSPWDVDTDDAVKLLGTDKASLFRIRRGYSSLSTTPRLFYKKNLKVVFNELSLTDVQLPLEGFWGITTNTMNSKVSMLSCFFEMLISCSSS
jgi:hypothetical protein